MKFIILAQSKTTAKALHVWRELILGDDLAVGQSCIVFDLSRFAHEGGIGIYLDVVQRLEAACDFEHEPGGYDSTFVLVDSVAPSMLDVSADAVTWDKLIAMLILTFPEVHWVFGVLRRSAGDESDFPRELHNLASIFDPRECLLFDSTGLRDWIRGVTANSLALRPSEESTEIVSYLPRRREYAIALDDETAYSYLNAYTAYRFGFRGLPVYTHTLATELLRERKAHERAPRGCASDRHDIHEWPPRVIFEDIYLNFSDGRPGLSKLYADSEASPGESRGRCLEWTEIENIPNRIFLTSGQRLHRDDAKHERNAAYLSGQKALGTHIRVLHKPYAGMFKLWRQSGLAARLEKGLAKGFVWPPSQSVFTDDPHGHSSPGPLHDVAETLIHRAKALKRSGASSVEDAVRGAVLAVDALELLGGRTGTASVAALRLKHEFELLAECQFAGVEHHFEIRERLREIQRDCGYLGGWFGPEQHVEAALNAEMQVLLDLVPVLRQYGQFDEELSVMSRIRSIHNTLWMRKRAWRWVMMPVLRYIEFLLGSFPRFCLSLAAWVIVLAGMFWMFEPVHTGAMRPEIRSAIRLALESFVGKGLPSQEINFIMDSLYIVATVAGLLHVGAFVSLLYSNVTRK